MKISIDIPNSLDPQIMSVAKEDGHTNRAAAIRKMIFFYFEKKSPFVARRLSKMNPRKKQLAAEKERIKRGEE